MTRLINAFESCDIIPPMFRSPSSESVVDEVKDSGIFGTWIVIRRDDLITNRLQGPGLIPVEETTPRCRVALVFLAWINA